MRHFLELGRVPRSRRKWIAMAVLVLLAGAVIGVLFLRDVDFDWQRLNQTIDRLPPLAVLPLMAILPVFGFPVVLVYLLAGARFGPVMGGLVVAGATAAHLGLSHLIARSFLRRPIQRWIERRQHHLPQVPEDEGPAVALVAALVPGIPYVVRNYLLALIGLRFRVYFWICLPVYVARSYATILFGDLSSDPSRKALFVIVGIDVLKVAICALVLWWLRQHHRKYHGHDDAAAAAPPTGAGR